MRRVMVMVMMDDRSRRMVHDVMHRRPVRVRRMMHGRTGRRTMRVLRRRTVTARPFAPGAREDGARNERTESHGKDEFAVLHDRFLS